MTDLTHALSAKPTAPARRRAFWLKRAVRELARLCAQYTRAVAYEARGRLHRVPSVIYMLLIARLRYGVGPRYYSLFELGSRPRSDWDQFITDTPAFKDAILAMSPKAIHAIAYDKALFYSHCRRQGLPTVPVHCLLLREGLTAPDNIPLVADMEQWKATMGECPKEIFVKTVDGTFGEGAFPVTRCGPVVRFLGRTATIEELYLHLHRSLKHERGWLVQPMLHCHESLRCVMSASGLGTVRLVTHMDKSEPRLLFALLKLTVGTNTTDNFHYGTTGNLVARIDLDSGRLYAARGSASTRWPVMTEIHCHPDTSFPIAGFQVPFWEDVVELALRAQRSLPLLKSTGWDIGITPQGPVLIETNASYSVDIMQVAYGRGLKADISRALSVPVT